MISKIIMTLLFVTINFHVNAQLVEEKKIYEYDNLNRLVKVVFNDGNTKEYVYDNLDNRIQVNLQTLNVDTETLQNVITVYPNPTSEIININLPDRILNQSVEVKIYDVNGREIKTTSKSVENTNFSINVNSYPVGVYLIRIHNGNEKWSQMFIKK